MGNPGAASSPLFPPLPRESGPRGPGFPSPQRTWLHGLQTDGLAEVADDSQGVPVGEPTDRRPVHLQQHIARTGRLARDHAAGASAATRLVAEPPQVGELAALGAAADLRAQVARGPGPGHRTLLHLAEPVLLLLQRLRHPDLRCTMGSPRAGGRGAAPGPAYSPARGAPPLTPRLSTLAARRRESPLTRAAEESRREHAPRGRRRRGLRAGSAPTVGARRPPGGKGLEAEGRERREQLEGEAPSGTRARSSVARSSGAAAERERRDQRLPQLPGNWRFQTRRNLLPAWPLPRPLRPGPAPSRSAAPGALSSPARLWGTSPALDSARRIGFRQAGGGPSADLLILIGCAE